MSFHSPPAVFVRHVQIKTTDLGRSLAFYRDILGFRLLEQDERTALLTADGKTSLVSLVQPDDVITKPPGTVGLYHLALLLPNRSDLAALVTHLSAQGVRFGASNHLVSEAIYFQDPDGIGIEVYTDTDPTTWKWSNAGVAMDTLPLDFDSLLDASQGPWHGFPQDTIIGHIHLQVSKLAPAEIFYTQGLGFEVAARYGAGARFLSTEKYHHHIAFNTWLGEGAPQAPRNSAGLDFFTLAFPDERKLEETVGRLKTLGWEAKKAGTACTIEDPSGNTILLTA